MAHYWLALTLGILGNIVSLVVRGVAPMPTFWRIWKKRSSEGFSADPYVVGVVNGLLWLYYGLLLLGDGDHGLLIANVSGVGSLFQALYLALYLLFASRPQRVHVIRLLLLSSFIIICTLATTLTLSHGNKRVQIVGVLSDAFAIFVYGAPLSIMGQVIRTKSVEFMPFYLSLFLFMTAGIWSSYAFVVRDIFIGVPSIVGFILGILQLVLFARYWKPSNVKEVILDVEKLPSGPTSENLSNINQTFPTTGMESQCSIDCKKNSSIELDNSGYSNQVLG